MAKNSNNRNCDYLLKIVDLTKKIGEKNILNGISLTLSSNSFTAIMGPSGAGKSSLLNVASGLETATSGQVWIGGTDIVQLKEPRLTKFRNSNIGYIFQDYQLMEYLNVRQNITLPQDLHHRHVDKKRLSEIIWQVGLRGYERVNTSRLSGGQQQRVAIARALLGNNPIIFGDEPTGALDLANRDSIVTLLKNTTSQYGKGLVVVTHDPVVASYADQIVYLLNGSVNAISGKDDSSAIAQRLLELEKNVKIID